jgi:hypothetical protein
MVVARPKSLAVHHPNAFKNAITVQKAPVLRQIPKILSINAFTVKQHQVHFTKLRKHFFKAL